MFDRIFKYLAKIIEEIWDIQKNFINYTWMKQESYLSLGILLGWMTLVVVGSDLTQSRRDLIGVNFSYYLGDNQSLEY